MKKTINPFRISFTILILAMFLLLLVRVTGEEFEDVGTKQTPTAAKWGGARWTTAERKTFQGRPLMATDNDTIDFITVAYGRYVSYYDLKHFAPCWVAYVTDKASAIVTKNRSRTSSEFDRPSRGFSRMASLLTPVQRWMWTPRNMLIRGHGAGRGARCRRGVQNAYGGESGAPPRASSSAAIWLQQHHEDLGNSRRRQTGAN